MIVLYSFTKVLHFPLASGPTLLSSYRSLQVKSPSQEMGGFIGADHMGAVVLEHPQKTLLC